MRRFLLILALVSFFPGCLSEEYWGPLELEADERVRMQVEPPDSRQANEISDSFN
jgi:hypothetical protein